MWEEGSGEKGVIFDGGDAISVKLSPDKQLLAFLRRTIIRRSDMDWYEQSSLWVMDRDGGNLRQLVSAEGLRELIASSDTDSSNMPQVEWIPGTHQLAFTAYNYFVQAEGESHAFPTGLFLVNADTAELQVLVSAGTSLKFSPAPDGQRLALMSLTGFGFLAADGSGQYQEVLTYPQVVSEAQPGLRGSGRRMQVLSSWSLQGRFVGFQLAVLPLKYLPPLQIRIRIPLPFRPMGSTSRMSWTKSGT